MSTLNGNIALVTGGASGIGRAICHTFAAAGARVVVADLNQDGGRQTAAGIGEAALFHRLDVTDEAGWIETTHVAEEHFGGLDIVVNCAGIGFSSNVEDIELAAWNQILAVNLTGVMLGTKHGIRTIKTSGKAGAIINMSSIAGLVGTADLAAYCASKGGVSLFTKAAALNCAQLGYPIRCNAILPTYVDSEMLDPVAEMFESRDQMRAEMAKDVPIGRLAIPQDIANAALFLASQDAAMITGVNFIVDGGTTAGLPAHHSG